MPKNWSDRAIMSCMIGLVAWGIIGLPTFRAFWPTNQAAYAQTGQPSSNATKTEEPWLTKDAAGFFTFLLVVVGGLQLALFVWQLGLIRESLDDAKIAAEAAKESADVAKAQLALAERSLTIAERALVAVSDIVVTTISQHQIIVDYRIHINIINSGKTPARNYLSRANLVVVDRIPDNFRFPDRPTKDTPDKGVIGPQSRTYFLIDLFIQDAIATYERRKRTFIYGWLEYDAIFPSGSRHRTEFCMEVEVFADPRHTPQIIQGRSVPILTVRPYGRYNSYDEDCLYRPGQTPIAEEGELPEPTLPPEGIKVAPS